MLSPEIIYIISLYHNCELNNMENKNQCRQCAVCGKEFATLKDLVFGEVIRNVISDEIIKDHPD
jgi:hypothetical protein